jgi:hypothetical protein
MSLFEAVYWVAWFYWVDRVHPGLRVTGYGSRIT